MDNPQALNSNTYVIAIDNTSKSATFTESDKQNLRVILYNGSDKDVFCVLGKQSAPTAVFPTSATVPLSGKVVGPGQMVTFAKTSTDKYISAIQASAGTGSLYISVGSGE